MPSPEIKTLILRFRDLVTRPGDTIAQHQAISEKSGEVWWGWWNKAGETVPDEAFRLVSRAAEAPEGLEALLLDSDRSQLFKARCREIRWNTQHSPLLSPGPSPGYYKDRHCLAWFHFESISADPLPESVLRQFSYVEVSDFFETGESGYKAFYGKRIASARELLQQNRTIWFVRDAKPEDRVHEISLLDSHRVEPSDFPREHLISSSTDLLWVSDLHFSDDDHHAFAAKSDHSGRTVWDSIEKSLRESGIENVGGVIVSGDLVWKAAPTEFEKARSFFDGARTWGNLKNYDFLVCPGNHDIAFSSDPADKDQPVTVAPVVARAAYERFYQDLYFKKPNQFLSCGRRFLLGGAIPVEMACLNSSLLEQEKNLFQGHGFVGDPQMDHAAHELGWVVPRKRPRALRIVIVHHHLLPVTYRDVPLRQRQYSVTLDAEALTRWLLKHEVDIVLHGHQHQPFWTRVVRPIDIQETGAWRELVIVGLGSTGVEQSHLGEIRNNVFAVLSFGERDVRFRFFSVHPDTPSKLLFDFSVDLSSKSRLA
jgi:hypothetical protein